MSAVSLSKRDEIVGRLRALLADGAVLSGADIGERYSVDYTGENPCEPLAVVKPGSTEEVAAVLRTCSEFGQPLVVQGGLTGLAGGATPREGEIAMSMERLNGIEELDPVSMTITARAGTPLQAVQEAAAEAGLLLPLGFRRSGFLPHRRRHRHQRRRQSGDPLRHGPQPGAWPGSRAGRRHGHQFHEQDAQEQRRLRPETALRGHRRHTRRDYPGRSAPGTPAVEPVYSAVCGTIVCKRR